MPPENPKPGDQNTPEPGTPPATPPQADPPVTKDDDEIVEIKRKDLNNIISQRDRNAEAARQNSASDNFLMELAVERTVNKFLTDHKEKYPDVNTEDLMHVDDPDQLEAEATRIQTKISQAVQQKLQSVQITETPPLTETQKTEKLAELQKSGKRRKFGDFLRIQQS
jgi:hypothetical protein